MPSVRAYSYTKYRDVHVPNCGYDPADQAEFAALSRAKFCSRTIVDTVARSASAQEIPISILTAIIGEDKHSLGKTSIRLAITDKRIVVIDQLVETIKVAPDTAKCLLGGRIIATIRLTRQKVQVAQQVAAAE